MTKEQKMLQKAKIKTQLAAEKDDRKRVKTLSAEEQKKARLLQKEERAKAKAALAALPAEEKKAQKRFNRKLKRTRNLPRNLGIVGAVVVLLFSTIGYQYYLGARAESPEILAAKAASRLVAEQIQAEGTVLLKNDNNALPLTGGKVNLFGVRAITPSYGGGGSGSIDSKGLVSLYEALASEQVEINKELFNLYCNWGFDQKISTKEYKIKEKTSILGTILPNIMGILGTEKIDEIPSDKIPQEVMANAQAFSDTAIMVLGLSSRETISEDGVADNMTPSLQLSENDRELLEMLNNNFKNVVVLLNSGNPLELGWLEEYENVNAALWIAYPGEAGFTAIAKILTGTYNPSGRTVDTFAYDSSSSPAAKNVGNFEYENLPGQHFMNYSEGIYVGYRFYETYYENDDAGYKKAVQFPFGYGLSYTDFKWETVNYTEDADKMTIDVKVTNTGGRAGKDVVEVYYTPPYSAASGIEKAAMNLVGFAKTKELKPQESQTVTISFDIKNMASYDYKTTQGWVLEKGDYEIKICKNVHEVLETRRWTLAENKVYKTDDNSGTEVENLFESANGGLEYLSRSDFEGGFAKITQRSHNATQEIIDAVKYEITPTEGTMPAMNQNNNIKLKDLAGLAYEDQKWQLFLDQFKLDEMIRLVSAGGWKTTAVDRLGVPATFDVDGPASMRHYFSKWATVGYPSAIVVTQTWNEELQFEMAAAMAREGVLYDINVWYAPAMNLHRTPFGGRNFEYLTEDPFLAGKTSAAQIRGAYTEGIGVTMKHFALNDSETNRTGVFLWANEQALRELYLKPFEMSVKEGGAFGAMTSMTRIGHTWCGENSALLNDLLREEWGFRGYVVTDITIGDYMHAPKCITNGNDAMLFLTSGGHEKEIKAAYKIDPTGIANGLRTSTHNICYMVLNTNAMDKVNGK